MCAAFQSWKRYGAGRQALIRTALERIAGTEGLSRDTTEMVTRILDAWTGRRASGPAPVFSYCRQGRSLTAARPAAAWAALLLLLGLGMQAAPWLVILLALPLLPVLWDLWRNPAAGMSLDGSTLSWFTGARQGKAELADVEKIRFDTRWDFSVRVTLVMDSGRSCACRRNACRRTASWRQR